MAMARNGEVTVPTKNPTTRVDEDLPEYYNSTTEPDSNLPEPFEEQGKEVITSPHSEGGHLVEGGEGIYVNERSNRGDVAPVQPKILGLRRRYFYIILGAIVIIIGAVIGGVLGSTSNSRSGGDQAESGLAGRSSSSMNSATTSATSSPSSTPSVITGKSKFKYPSIALTGTGSPWRSYLFTLHNSNNSITYQIKGYSGWKMMDRVPTTFVPLAASPLTAVSWTDGDDEVRLYYVDDQSQIIQIRAQCDSGAMTCKWEGSQVILSSGIASTSGLSAMIWGNGSTADPYQIRLYYADDKNYMFDLRYSGSWSTSGNNLGFTISTGSGIAAQAEQDVDPVVQRVFYVDLNGDVKGLRGSPGYSLGVTPVEYSTTSVLSRIANIATCLYHSTDRKQVYLTVKQIGEDGSVIEARKVASQGDWTTNVGAGDWDRADDAGGALACAGWIDDDNRSNQLLVYTVNGSVTDYSLLAGTWSRTVVFDD